jgi:hypothetical protein
LLSEKQEKILSIPLLCWLFALGVIIHNIEEAILLPQWSTRSGHWQYPITAGAFRFAITILSIAVLLAAWLAISGGAGSFGVYFMAGYVLTMLVNILVPHLGSTIILRQYAPGTATALLFNLPLGSWLLYLFFSTGSIDPAVFIYAGPLTLLGILASLPLLFAIGKKLPV